MAIQKRFQVVINIEVSVLELTPSRVLESHARRAAEREVPGTPPPSSASIERQRCLQEQLLSSPDHLRPFLEAEVIQELQIVGLPQLLAPKRDTAFFLPLIEKLRPRERHALREALARGSIVEHIEELLDSVEVTVRTVSLTELNR